MFGATTHAGNGATSEPYPEEKAGAATIADVSANGAQANEVAAESRPGEAAGVLGDFSDLTYGDLIPDAAQYTEQWQQVQFKFVDDPRASVTEAADIITQVTARLEAAIQERQRAIEETAARHRRAAALAARPVGRGHERRHRGAARDAADVHAPSSTSSSVPRPVNQARLADAGRTE